MSRGMGQVRRLGLVFMCIASGVVFPCSEEQCDSVKRVAYNYLLMSVRGTSHLAVEAQRPLKTNSYQDQHKGSKKQRGIF